ncbi:DUF6916 family protein [Sphingomonas sp. 37zxx]|uniref:DUF6916 family protein n=1 Tax=Sphingomonas sp. 37zxx TaxID=1550073 RepID=UPI00053BF8E8|nr:hypothetical protein [Sphingomonas sp. 37zxx]
MTKAWLELDQFAPYLEQDFIAGPEPTAPVLTLIEAEPLRNHGVATRAPFALLFRSNHTPMLEQGQYRLTHAVAGTHDIFLVPVGRNDGGILYEAIFN